MVAQRELSGTPPPDVEWQKILQHEVKPLFFRHFIPKNRDPFEVVLKALVETYVQEEQEEYRIKLEMLAQAAEIHNQFNHLEVGHTRITGLRDGSYLGIRTPSKPDDKEKYFQLDTPYQVFEGKKGVPNMTLQKQLLLENPDGRVNIRQVASFMAELGMLHLGKMLDYADANSQDHLSAAKPLYSDQGELVASLHAVAPFERDPRRGITFSNPQRFLVDIRPIMSDRPPTDQDLYSARHRTMVNLDLATKSFQQAA